MAFSYFSAWYDFPCVHSFFYFFFPFYFLYSDDSYSYGEVRVYVAKGGVSVWR